MKPQYQRSNQALKAYYKNTIPCQSNAGSQLKYRKKTEKQANIHQANDQLNKSNEDIDWLQKIVNGFEWYKDKQDPLFLDAEDNIQVNQYNYKQRELQNKNIHQICNKESICLKSKGEYSQRVMDNKIVPSNNSNRSNQNNKSRELKSQVFQKNSSFGKNIIAYSVKNKRSDSQNSIVSKKKECSISISQLAAKRQKMMDMQREKDRQKERAIEKQKQKEREVRQRQMNQKEIKKKNMDQTQKICDLIEVCGITDINSNILKMKTKLSMQEKNGKLNSKIASIKAERKNLREVITEQKSKYGKIIKNKSVDLKQRSKTMNSVQNPYAQKQRNQVEDKCRVSMQKQKGPANQKPQEKYLVQQFNEEQENANKLKQNNYRKAQTDSRKPLQTNFNINNQIEKLILRQRDPNISILKTSQHQIQKQNKMTLMENICKGDKQNESYSIRKQNQSKKYYYLLDKPNAQQRQQKIFVKKQRRLNSSFGQRKLIYNYNEQKSFQPINSSNNIIQNSNKELLKENETKKNGHAHMISFSQKKVQGPQQISQISAVGEKKQQDVKKKQNLDQKKKILESSVYRNVKFVQSTKNSQVWTDHSISIVLDKHLSNAMEENSQSTPVKNDPLNQQWNILDIFSKLDCRKLGILSANNCSIQYVSREIRYILGPVLEQILYKNTKYNFTEFIQRVQNTLEHVKDSQLPAYQPQRYLKIKEWAPETQRVQQPAQKYNSNELAYRSSNTSNTLKQLSKSPQVQDSRVRQTLTKKYEYTKTFYEQVNTQPSIKMKKKQNNEVIRFATFQDQDMIQQENEGCFVFKNIEMSKSKTNGINQFEQEYSRVSKQNMEQKLQKKLATLNLFQSTFGSGLQHKIEDDKLVASIIKSRCRSDAQKIEYKNEIVKLELLNQRLQRYLHDQTLKQYSTSKLLDGEI